MSSTPSLFIEGPDSAHFSIPAAKLIPGTPDRRTANDQAARLGTQFLQQNHGLLRDFGVSADLQYKGGDVQLMFHTGTNVGATPLLSPTSGRPDYGLIISPRFAWSGVGLMLSTMGWKVLPTPLKLPLLPRSERKIPPWVLSSMILFRLSGLLAQQQRRFEQVEMTLPAPRGTINWQSYITQQMPRGQFLEVPCRFPDLQQDRALRAAIHFTLRHQWHSLHSQRSGGAVVLQLIALCQSLLQQVQDVPAQEPTPRALQSWIRNPLKTAVFRNGIEAMEWTVDERGLAGLSDLQGIPWILPMEQFFEAWVETAVGELAKRIGGQVKSGRLRQTIVPIQWEPAYVGSQKYLLPDVILERGDETFIFDAKYKKHWEEMQFHNWHQLEQTIRDHHRQDLLQALAYANVASSRRVVTCLIYPCQTSTWISLKARGRLAHHATIPAGDKQLELILTAVPMDQPLAPTIGHWVDLFTTSH